jgi:hypothetical protein
MQSKPFFRHSASNPHRLRITYRNLILIALLLSCNTYAGWGQNLVNNWSFEDTVACPNNVDQVYKATGWSSYRKTPDYFNACNNTWVSVPLNAFGEQAARTGIAYAGFFLGAFNYREIIGTQLLQPLSIGTKYYVSFFVSRAGYSFINTACNKIGIHLSTQSFSFSNPIPINNISQVYTDSVIIDTLNWTQISGSFVADSSYQFLSIGSFFNDTLITYIFFGAHQTLCYYYIDDVKLSTDSIFVNEVNSPSDWVPFKIFPNPARDWIIVEGGNIKSIEVFDLCGRIVLPKMTVSSFKTQVDISALSHGVYIIKANTSTNNSFINKFIHF